MCDRPPTNIEMFDAIRAKWSEHRAKVDRDGCCGGELMAGGACPETGRVCPLYQEAEKIERTTFKREMP